MPKVGIRESDSEVPEFIPPVQKVLAEWTGKEMAALQAASVAIGCLVGNGVLTFRQAQEKLQHSAEVRGYNRRFDSDDVADCVEFSLRSGQFSQTAANDNERNEIQGAFTSQIALKDLTYPGGIVSELIDWTVASSIYPSRELALGPAIAFVGALAGRRFSSPTDLRTNHYIVALAPSGHGKDHSRNQLKRLITAANLDRFSGPSRFMSATALRNTVMDKPSCLCMIDEFGGMMRQINDPRASIHSMLIRSDLLELFTSASTYFEGAAYAQTPAQRIHNPNYCMYGTSTPEDYWKSVSSLNTADGLLARFILLNIDGPKPRRAAPTVLVTDVPAALVDKVQTLCVAGRTSGRFPVSGKGDQPEVPIVVQYSPEAQTELGSFQAIVAEKELAVSAEAAPILNRTVEHAIKLALTVSVGLDPATPIITGPAMTWGCQLAWLSTCTMIEETADRISDNSREADLKRILGLIKRARQDGISEGKLVDRSGSIDRNRRNELLADLMLAGHVEERVTPTKGRPRKRYHII